MSDDLLRVDDRGRVTLGKHATHEYYALSRDEAGRIILTPTILLPADHPLAARLAEPRASNRAGRPQRHADPDERA